jgi:hypothetical protein
MTFIATPPGGYRLLTPVPLFGMAQPTQNKHLRYKPRPLRRTVQRGCLAQKRSKYEIFI